MEDDPRLLILHSVHPTESWGAFFEELSVPFFPRCNGSCRQPVGARDPSITRQNRETKACCCFNNSSKADSWPVAAEIKILGFIGKSGEGRSSSDGQDLRSHGQNHKYSFFSMTVITAVQIHLLWDRDSAHLQIPHELGKSYKAKQGLDGFLRHF